jgi:hypothetical protein
MKSDSLAENNNGGNKSNLSIRAKVSVVLKVTKYKQKINSLSFNI